MSWSTRPASSGSTTTRLVDQDLFASPATWAGVLDRTNPAERSSRVRALDGLVSSRHYGPIFIIGSWDKTLLIRVIADSWGGATDTVRSAIAAKVRPACAADFVELTFEFRVLVDAFATYQYVELPVQPTIAVLAGPPIYLEGGDVLTLAAFGETFRLGFIGISRIEMGQPERPGREALFSLRAARPIAGLPEKFSMKRGEHARVRSRACRSPSLATWLVEVLDPDGKRALPSATRCASPPRRRCAPTGADLHGQSEETIGTNSARDLIEFARDRAFLDAHEPPGQRLPDHHAVLERAEPADRATTTADGAFVIFPGYEWSGNTGLGGDRNVMFMREGQPDPPLLARPGRRPGRTSPATRNSAEQLFRALEGRGLRRVRPYRRPLCRHQDGA